MSTCCLCQLGFFWLPVTINSPTRLNRKEILDLTRLESPGKGLVSDTVTQKFQCHGRLFLSFSRLAVHSQSGSLANEEETGFRALSLTDLDRLDLGHVLTPEPITVDGL